MRYKYRTDLAEILKGSLLVLALNKSIVMIRGIPNFQMGFCLEGKIFLKISLYSKVASTLHINVKNSKNAHFFCSIVVRIIMVILILCILNWVGTNHKMLVEYIRGQPV